MPERGKRGGMLLVVARAANGVIGRNGKLPWHLPADLRHFKEVTSGTAMIMGRRTFESLPGPLPGRRHVVLTRAPGWRADGAEVVHTVEEAVARAGADPVTVIGGAEIFALFEELAAAVELTEIHAEVEGDTTMPAFDPKRWREAKRMDHPPEGGRPAYSFVRLERR